MRARMAIFSRRAAAVAALAFLGAGCGGGRAPAAPSSSTTTPPPPPSSGTCGSCHGLPPATGAHLLHSRAAARDGLSYGDLAVLEDFASGGDAYGFGCGHCHPLDPALHEIDAGADGLPDVDLRPPTDPALASTLKARNAPTAAWDPATGTCSGVWCHSTGTAVPEYRTTPPWTAAPGTLGCNGCHDDPPRYPSAGPTSAAPNSHLQLGSDLWEWGHFAGMPGPYHPGGSKHGGGAPSVWPPGTSAAPITCQTCHADTVDPSSTAPGGFFWLDTTGDYALPGGKAARLTDPVWLASQCGSCHDGVNAPVGKGRVLPLRHVNGRADVVFDVRASLPAGYPTGLPSLVTADPIAPYTMSGCDATLDPALLPPGTILRAATDGSTVLTMSLGAARYDPVTRTCTNIACHLEQQSLVDGTPPLSPLQWGNPYIQWSCNGCHPMF
jgi:predicted CxxxxCH...CXXCH cytochrome family protein